jgi:hypothetical protein
VGSATSAAGSLDLTSEGSPKSPEVVVPDPLVFFDSIAGRAHAAMPTIASAASPLVAGNHDHVMCRAAGCRRSADIHSATEGHKP